MHSKKRLGEVALLAIILTGCRMLVVLVCCWVQVSLFLLNWICGAFVIAVVAEKAWGLVTSFKIEWRLLLAWNPVDVVVIGMQICKIINAESSFETGCCFAGLTFGSCKKLEVIIAGPLLRTWSCLKCTERSFWSRIILLGIFGLIWEACTLKTNALQLVEWKNTIHTRNRMSAKIILWFIFAKDSPFVIVTRWCLKVMGLINCENHCEDHCPSIGEGHHQCPNDADNQVFQMIRVVEKWKLWDLCKRSPKTFQGIQK